MPIRSRSLRSILENSEAPEIRDVVFAESVWRMELVARTHEHTYVRKLQRVDEFDVVDGFKFAKRCSPLPRAPHNEELYGNTGPRSAIDLAGELPELADSYDRLLGAFAEDELGGFGRPATIDDPEHYRVPRELGYTE